MSVFINALISHFGSQAATAQELGVSQATVSYWLSGQQSISPRKAVLAHKKTMGAVTASDLCPLIAEAVALQTLEESSQINPALASGPDGSVDISSAQVGT
ncbi:transcriptional regulator [Pseudomonas coronafaciens]|uniref:transcriptional regulator n=1 Tax=Pseudomonas coronafaciens TaxID=53409 RepID=UPI000EFFD059|nr:YdaS family helix-turn-helix protein [Pseudomonas coronafaciens]